MNFKNKKSQHYRCNIDINLSNLVLDEWWVVRDSNAGPID